MSADLEESGGRCANCAATLSGAYCVRCGQRAEPHIHTLWGFTREATESLTHADSRLWRTLTSLLVKPGALTREFLNGRRVSYLPPFRLYLVVSLLFFLVASLLGASEDIMINGGTATVAPPRSQKARAQLTELAQEGERLAASKDPGERAAGERLAQLARKAPTGAPGETGESGETKPCNLQYGGPWREYLQPRLQRGCDRVMADDGRALGREFMANVPRMLFLFLPLIAMVMMLMYWRPRRYYVEHLLFFVHNHAFAFVLFTLMILVTAPLPEGIGGLVQFATIVYAAWYFFRAMRVVYGQSRGLTFAKYSALLIAYLVGGSVLTALTMLYTFISI